METFSVVLPSIPPIWIGLVALAVVIAVVMLSRGRTKNNIIGAIVVLIIIGASAGLVYYVSNSRPATIAVESGQFTISAQQIGTYTYTSAEIQNAYVTNLGSGVLSSVSRQHGYESSGYNVGVYTLSGGKTAYVISENNTNLVVQLDSGMYLVLSPANFTTFVNYFSENVSPVANLTS